MVGDVQRVFADFSLEMDIPNQKPESRLRNAALDAGSLLDVGIYSLTWAMMALDSKVGNEAKIPTVSSAMTFYEGVDLAASVILYYPTKRSHGICTCSLSY